MFNEKNTEYYNGQNMRVVQTAKYKQSKEKALSAVKHLSLPQRW